MGAIVWLHERWWWQHRCSTHAAGVEGVPGKDAAAEERRVGQLLALPPSLRANLWGSVYQPASAGKLGWAAQFAASHERARVHSLSASRMPV